MEVPGPSHSANRNLNRIAATIVHELFHLQRRANRFPICRLRRLLSCPSNVPSITLTRPQLSTLGLEISNLLEHYIFYDDMRQWGMQPEVETLQTINQMAYAGSRPGASRFPREIEAAVAVLQGLIEVRNTTLANDLRIAMESFGYRRSVESAYDAYSMISRVGPTTPCKQALLCKWILEAILDVDVGIVFKAEKRGKVKYCIAKAVIHSGTPLHRQYCSGLRCSLAFYMP